MDISEKVEHTVLGPNTTIKDVRGVLNAAKRENMRACIPPCFVGTVRDDFPDISISTVVGFPHGQNSSSVKAVEAGKAVSDGADEIDMVANIGLLKDGNLEKVEKDIRMVVDQVNVPVKVIICTPLLTNEEKHTMCEVSKQAGADFVKTATGFNKGGATEEDVQLMSEYLPVKASGGIRSGEEASKMFEAGAKRIGASSGVSIVNDLKG